MGLDEDLSICDLLKLVKKIQVQYNIVVIFISGKGKPQSSCFVYKRFQCSLFSLANSYLLRPSYAVSIPKFSCLHEY